jgi:hypothetical protein
MSDERPMGDRDTATGRVLPGNQIARKAGVRAFELHGEAVLSAELRDDLAAFRAGVEADQGGADELTTIASGYIRRLGELEAICNLLGADLQARGLFTRRGRVRSTYMAFMAAVDRWDRLATRLGMARRPRPVVPINERLSRPVTADEAGS